MDPINARALAKAVVSVAGRLDSVGAVGDLHLMLLADPSVQETMPSGVSNDLAQQELITGLAVRLARRVLGVWSHQYPDQLGPVWAVEAAETWATCPCALHAENASMASPSALRQAQMAWHAVPKSAAWAGRTAAWAADAPKFRWPAVAAIIGASKALNTDQVVDTAQAFFLETLKHMHEPNG